ncbi:MAG: ABC transporter substrate-binding protein, partial [Planctomycetota bacterium]
THATNIPLMIETISYNLTKPCYGRFHPDAEHFNKSVKLLDYDLDKAAALLDEVGWKVSDEDGWRYKDGKKFSFTFLYSQGSSAAEQIAAIVGEDLKSLGVEMKTQVMEWAAFSEKTRKHDFQAATAAWGTGVDPDTNWNIWHTEAYTKGRNYGGFSNKRVDELFEKARTSFDHEARMECYREIHKIIYDDQAYTFLWNMPVLWVFNKRMRGITYSPRGVWGFDPSISGWWVKKGEGMRAMK